MSRTDNTVPDPVTTDPDKYKVIFENDRVRVLDYGDKPGDKTKLHHQGFLCYMRLVPSNEESHLMTGRPQFGNSKVGKSCGPTNNHISEKTSDRQTLRS